MNLTLRNVVSYAFLEPENMLRGVHT